ncbi:lymphatic vessel endothelial hyaluronic acid receptor 1 [Rana temporaria]|uniref:lymphatic vessel endothelial hyaluronic acid receptor 1 n=1 Tax=Rana temporaria TaxID=8407 RepID=UPI001AAD145D|nr:lymphatic vessel endothelial hyaluronic acid receptor 1 [Rana temporaria]
MDSHLGFTFVLLSLFLRINLNFSSIDVKDLLPLKCRIAGVVLVEKKFNYTMAETACELLGLQLASRANVQKAWSFGFETCSYGWVMEKFGVISRIQNNEKCGKNLTGVLTWTVPLSRDFSAYCFNASDLRINSCKPQLMVTIPPSTVAPTTGSPLLPTTHQQIPEPQERSTAWPILPTTLEESTRRPLLTTLVTTVRLPPKVVPPATTPKHVLPATTPKQVPPATTPRMTTQPPTEEPTNPPENQARQSEKIVFGKLPTVLLILALVFFVAAVVLAICYIRKYKTNVFFRKIKEEKESVETKVFRETATAENTKEEEVSSNGREERPPTSEANTGSSMEAEV